MDKGSEFNNNIASPAIEFVVMRKSNENNLRN
jgi:hypothetical protein